MASNLIVGVDFSDLDDEDCGACDGSGECQMCPSFGDCEFCNNDKECLACCGTGIQDYEEPEQPGDFE